jgi:hypothetical protein
MPQSLSSTVWINRRDGHLARLDVEFDVTFHLVWGDDTGAVKNLGTHPKHELPAPGSRAATVGAPADRAVKRWPRARLEILNDPFRSLEPSGGRAARWIGARNLIHSPSSDA